MGEMCTAHSRDFVFQVSIQVMWSMRSIISTVTIRQR